MSTNLRLSDQAADALRDTAKRTGRTQQDLLREAVDEYLGRQSDVTTREEAVARGLVRSPTPFRDSEPKIVLSKGTRSIDLLSRDADR